MAKITIATKILPTAIYDKNEGQTTRTAAVTRRTRTQSRAGAKTSTTRTRGTATATRILKS